MTITSNVFQSTFAQQSLFFHSSLSSLLILVGLFDWMHLLVRRMQMRMLLCVDRQDVSVPVLMMMVLTES